MFLPIEANSVRSYYFELSRSIRQGCPLVVALFLIAVESLHYLLQDSSLSLKVLEPLLLIGDEISNIKFFDNTTIIFSLEEVNMKHLMIKLGLLCDSLGIIISISKSILLGWNLTILPRCQKFTIN